MLPRQTAWPSLSPVPRLRLRETQLIPYRTASPDRACQALTLRQSFQAFGISLAGRARLTQRTYGIGLRRFEEYLRAAGIDPDCDTLDALDDFTLENFAVW